MAPSSSVLATAVLAAGLFHAHAACSDSIQHHSACAGNPYAESRVPSSDACCALCSSEEQCAQWTFNVFTRQCSRTSATQTIETGFSTFFSICGIRSPAPPTPVPPKPTADPKTWAVIVAGSNGYDNYRHQADACHAYQIAKTKGIPEEQIILMAYDDIAKDEENPFPGKLFNKPSKGPGKDVYAGCKIDYKGEDVTPKNFLKVLSGNGTGKVLKSTSEDHVFVFFTDHGATGLVAFPSEELHKAQLQKTIQQMYEDKMFKQLVFYLESCESGSMFEGMKTPGAYGLSASSADESSWGTYCDDTDTVDGKDLQTCLGDLFSVSWMEDSDVEDLTKETLQKQFTIVKKLTTKSHVEQWGDLTFKTEPVSDFIGPKADAVRMGSEPRDVAATAVSARQVDLHRHFRKYMAATTSEARLIAAAGLQRELTRQLEAEWVYMRFSELVYPQDAEKQLALRSDRQKPDHADCELRVHSTIRTECAARFNANSGFALQFHQVVVNACQAVASGLDVDLVAQATKACKASRMEADGAQLVV